MKALKKGTRTRYLPKPCGLGAVPMDQQEMNSGPAMGNGSKKPLGKREERKEWEGCKKKKEAWMDRTMSRKIFSEVFKEEVGGVQLFRG